MKTSAGLVPIAGSITYCVLYVIATTLYPGGSNFNRASEGYRWDQNYWCELLSPVAKNGEANPGQPVAFAALSVMAVSIGVCWYYPPTIFTHRYRVLTIRYCGIAAMFVSLALPFAHHDTIINIAALFTVMALLSTFFGLYLSRNHQLLAFGILCFILAATNKLVYEISPQTRQLPLIQAATFICFLAWFAMLGWRIHLTRN